VRFAPALEVLKRLLADGAVVHATDPEAISRTRALFPEDQYHDDPYLALQGADAALVCTEWDAFKRLDWERASKTMARRLILVRRTVYSPAAMRSLGFEYFSFGRT